MRGGNVEATERQSKWRIDEMQSGRRCCKAMPEGWRMTMWLKQAGSWWSFQKGKISAYQHLFAGCMDNSTYEGFTRHSSNMRSVHQVSSNLMARN